MISTLAVVTGWLLSNGVLQLDAMSTARAASAAASAPSLVAGPGKPNTAATAPCAPLVTALLTAEMHEVATGLPGQAATLETSLGQRYGIDSPSWRTVLQVRDRLLETASNDLLNTFNRDVAAELNAYAPTIRRLCAAPPA